jgi:hypothetical protein
MDHDDAADGGTVNPATVKIASPILLETTGMLPGQLLSTTGSALPKAFETGGSSRSNFISTTCNPPRDLCRGADPGRNDGGFHPP